MTMRARSEAVLLASDAGFKAGRAGKPHNPRNSRAWKDAYAIGRTWAADDADAARDDAHSWMLDPDMEAQG